MSQLRSRIWKSANNIGIKSLSVFQQSSISSILSNQNSVMLSSPNSGKSTAYVLALCEQISQGRGSTNYLADSTGSSLFSKPAPFSSSPVHGALVLVPTQELSLQIYKKFRQIAPWLNVFRANNYLAEQAGSVKFLYFHIMDVLVATPTHLNEILEYRISKEMSSIAPKHIVIEQMDYLLE